MRFARTLLTGLLRWLAEALVRLYYPRRTVDGAVHVPTTGPAMYVANHPNGLLDALVLRVSLERPARFLAKNTLWGNPFGRLAMDAFECLPVYRQQDIAVDERGQTVQRNEESFARCRAALAAGSELALYPEGTSHSEPRLKPLKTGAARIALSAATAGPSGGRPALALVPVGSHYENSSVFRSGVHMVVGAPIDLTEHLTLFATDQRQAIDGLTDQIRDRLTELVLQAETRELLAGIARVASWTPESPDDDTPMRRHARTRELLDAYARLKTSAPERLEEITRAVRRYARVVERLGVRDPWAVETPRVTFTYIVVALGRAILMAPVAVWGFVCSWIPYRLSGAASQRMTRDEDVLSTIKMIMGAMFLVGFWIIEGVLIGSRLGFLWGLTSFVLAPAAGYASLRFGETINDMAEALRHVGWRRRAAMARRLDDRRRRLAQDVAQALRQASS
jgi:glycerol-3-phosphate O-acyltransferase/dihydroxyacetone phosphate acyltransferase